MSAKVVLLASTPNATEAVATAAHRCVSLDDAASYMQHVQPDKAAAVIRKAVGMGHTSVLEHASFTFDISGISRSLSHQLVRFRIASFSQLSQRYCKGPFGFVTPPSIAANPELLRLYDHKMAELDAFYQFMVDAGIPAEDARFALPNACETALILTTNARELHHIFNLRCCTHAQWEIRGMANRMLELVKAREPVLFENAGPSCVKGYCPEGDRGCGRIPQ